MASAGAAAARWLEGVSSPARSDGLSSSAREVSCRSALSRQWPSRWVLARPSSAEHEALFGREIQVGADCSILTDRSDAFVIGQLPGYSPCVHIDYFHGMIHGEPMAQCYFHGIDYPADRLISLTRPGACCKAVRVIIARWSAIRSARYGRRMVIVGCCLARIALRGGQQ